MKDIIETKNVKRFLITSSILLLVISLIYIVYMIVLKAYVYPIKYDKYVIQAAKDNNIDPYLIFAIIKQESRFNKNACSSKNAKGLMQILDSTAEEISKSLNIIESNELDLFDPKVNIYIGVEYFKTLVDRYDGNIRLAICAYNAGLGNVDKWKLSEKIYINSEVIIANIPFSETREYLVNILNYYDKYVKLYE